MIIEFHVKYTKKEKAKKKIHFMNYLQNSAIAKNKETKTKINFKKK